MPDERYGGIKSSLQEDLEHVEHQLREHGVDPSDDSVHIEVDEGFADSAQATAERSEALALIEQLRTHRKGVMDAIERIDAGTYGKCERCGNEIPVERLEALPTAKLCVTCKQEVGG